MGLTSWKGSIVRKQDIIIAKNYLSEVELDKLNRLVTIFLESAELRVQERKDLTIDFWRANVDSMLSFQNQQVLIGPGSVSNQVMETKVRSVYDIFDKRRKTFDAIQADKDDMAQLKELEAELKNR